MDLTLLHNVNINHYLKNKKKRMKRQSFIKHGIVGL